MSKAVASTQKLVALAGFCVGIAQAKQKGKRRAGYGDQQIARLSSDLGHQLKRVFSSRTLDKLCQFYLTWSIPQTMSAQLKSEEEIEAQFRKSKILELAQVIMLPRSAYSRLLSVKNGFTCQRYEAQALQPKLETPRLTINACRELEN